MVRQTSIEWTDDTWNPVRGCSRISEGCRHCYAERVAARFSGPGQPYEGIARRAGDLITLGGPSGRDRVAGHASWTGEVRLVPGHLFDPLRWRKPRRIFVNSMSDLFHERLPDHAIDRVVAVMMINCLHATRGGHTMQTLTKRAARMREYFADPKTQERVASAAGQLMEDGWWNDAIALRKKGLVHPLLHWGVSVENQLAADERIPDLLASPAAVRFLSCEPLLGPLDLRHVQHDREFEVDALTGDHGVTRPLAGRGPGIDWVIAGCESGPGARPADVSWLRSLRDQCRESGVPFFLKQARAQEGITAGPRSTVHHGGVIGLPELDGQIHAAFPEGA